MRKVSGTKILSVLLAVSMFSLMLIVAGSAAIEVEEGDWVIYSVEAEIEEPEEMTDTTEYEEFEQLEWIKVEVENVSDTFVILKTTMHFKDGTEEMTTMPGEGFIIETDIVEDEEVTAPLFGSGMPLYIRGSKSRTYADARREVVYVGMDLKEMGMSMDFEACWDKATGILCEISMSMKGTVMGETMDVAISLEMTETNMWEAGEDTASKREGPWSWIIVVVVIIVAAVAAGLAVLLWRRRKQPLPEAAPAPTEQSESVTRLG